MPQGDSAKCVMLLFSLRHTDFLLPEMVKSADLQGLRMANEPKGTILMSHNSHDLYESLTKPLRSFRNVLCRKIFKENHHENSQLTVNPRSPTAPGAPASPTSPSKPRSPGHPLAPAIPGSP